MSDDDTRGKQLEGVRRYQERMKECREVLHQLTEDRAWDHLKARDVPPALIEFVEERIVAGDQPRQICVMLGLNRHGGVHSPMWKKIQANLRGGFRVDAEAFALRHTTQLFGVLQQLKATVEDAFENGTPHVLEDGHVVRVKGATKELGSIIETYSKAIQVPIKIWKDIGAVSEKAAPGSGSGGVTIVVKSAVQLPKQEDVDKYRQRYTELPVVDVTEVSSELKPKS